MVARRMAALYEPEDGGVFVPTAYTRGPWDPRHQHAGPPSALLVHAIEAAAGIADGQVGRIALDILRPVPLEPLRVAARHLRPGRRVEQLEAVLTLAADDTELMHARAWRLRSDPLELGDGREPPPPGPEDLQPAGRPSFWSEDTAYIDALEWRFAHGHFDSPGPAACWTRMLATLLPGRPASPLEHLLVMGDAASGISAVLDWSAWTFANVDLSVALERPPEGEWLGMEGVTRLGDRGAGVCSGAFFDAGGRVGSSSQALLIAPR